MDKKTGTAQKQWSSERHSNRSFFWLPVRLTSLMAVITSSDDAGLKEKSIHLGYLELQLYRCSSHTLFHVAGDKSWVDPPWTRGGGRLNVVEGQNWSHSAVNPDVSSQLLQQNKESRGQDDIHSDKHQRLRTCCINREIWPLPPTYYEALSSFASPSCTSPSPPLESAQQLQHEFVSLEGKSGERVILFQLKMETVLR